MEVHVVGLLLSGELESGSGSWLCMERRCSGQVSVLWSIYMKQVSLRQKALGSMIYKAVYLPVLFISGIISCHFLYTFCQTLARGKKGYEALKLYQPVDYLWDVWASPMAWISGERERESTRTLLGLAPEWVRFCFSPVAPKDLTFWPPPSLCQATHPT